MFFVFYIFNKEWWKSCQFFILFFCWLFSTKGLSLSALKSQQEVIVNLHLGFWFPLTSGWVYRTENETCLLWDITDIVNNNLLLTMKGFTCFFGKVTEQRLGREKLVGGAEQRIVTDGHQLSAQDAVRTDRSAVFDRSGLEVSGDWCCLLSMVLK